VSATRSWVSGEQLPVWLATYDGPTDRGIIMSTAISDAQKIAAVVDQYTKGCETGDGSYLKAAFHPDARMYGALGPDRHDIPVLGGMDAAVAEQPTGGHDAQILSIDVEGDAACVKLAESGFWGLDFIDYFILSRVNGNWQIVGKAFTSTGPSS